MMGVHLGAPICPKKDQGSFSQRKCYRNWHLIWDWQDTWVKGKARAFQVEVTIFAKVSREEHTQPVLGMQVCPCDGKTESDRESDEQGSGRWADNRGHKEPRSYLQDNRKPKCFQHERIYDLRLGQHNQGELTSSRTLPEELGRRRWHISHPLWL